MVFLLFLLWPNESGPQSPAFVMRPPGGGRVTAVKKLRWPPYSSWPLRSILGAIRRHLPDGAPVKSVVNKKKKKKKKKKKRFHRDSRAIFVATTAAVSEFLGSVSFLNIPSLNSSSLFMQ